MSVKSVNALDSLEDNQLLELIAQRDKLALSELYDRYRLSLAGFIRRKVYQEKLVDEIYNDVMMVVWQKADSFRGESKVSTWVFGVAYRICMSHARKEMKHTQNMAQVEFDNMPATPDESDVDSDRIDKLRRATAKLGDKQRVVIELTYFHGHSLSETAEIVDCPINTVKTRLFNARQSLKKLVNE